jgi:hypothetical protein
VKAIKTPPNGHAAVATASLQLSEDVYSLISASGVIFVGGVGMAAFSAMSAGFSVARFESACPDGAMVGTSTTAFFCIQDCAVRIGERGAIHHQEEDKRGQRKTSTEAEARHCKFSKRAAIHHSKRVTTASRLMS